MRGVRLQNRRHRLTRERVGFKIYWVADEPGAKPELVFDMPVMVDLIF